MIFTSWWVPSNDQPGRMNPGFSDCMFTRSELCAARSGPNQVRKSDRHNFGWCQTTHHITQICCRGSFSLTFWGMWWPQDDIQQAHAVVQQKDDRRKRMMTRAPWTWAEAPRSLMIHRSLQIYGHKPCTQIWRNIYCTKHDQICGISFWSRIQLLIYRCSWNGVEAGSSQSRDNSKVIFFWVGSWNLWLLVTRWTSLQLPT